VPVSLSQGITCRKIGLIAGCGNRLLQLRIE
jgi:hypothetical protein